MTFIPVLILISIMALLTSQIVLSLQSELKASRHFSELLQKKRASKKNFVQILETIRQKNGVGEYVGFIPDNLSVDCQEGQYLYRLEMKEDNPKYTTWVYYGQR